MNESMSVYARWGLWAAAAVLAFISFWRLPDFFFGRVLNDFRESQFRKLWDDANFGSDAVTVTVVSWDDCAVLATRSTGEAGSVEQVAIATGRE